jgi:phospholipase D1/2
MRPAPYPNDNEIGSQDDAAVADPLADSTLNLWYDTARKNREIFTEVFRPVPTNLVRDWAAYDVGTFLSFSQVHRNLFILRIEIRPKD